MAPVKKSTAKKPVAKTKAKTKAKVKAKTKASAPRMDIQAQMHRDASRISKEQVRWMYKHAPYDLMDAMEVGESTRSGMNRIAAEQAEEIIRNRDGLVKMFVEWMPDLDGEAKRDQNKIIKDIMAFRSKYGRKTR